jgi:hypothetical protein
VFQAVREYSEGHCLHPSDRVGLRLTVSHDARESWNLGQPTTVTFLFELYSEHHGDLPWGGKLATPPTECQWTARTS